MNNEIHISKVKIAPKRPLFYDIKENNQTTKLCLVFDTSARINSRLSLNDIQLGHNSGWFGINPVAISIACILYAQT